MESISRVKFGTRNAYVLLSIIFAATLAFAPYAWTAAPTSAQAAAIALQQLLDGNARYVGDKATHPAARPSDAAQHPIAAVLSCSDSRVPPEIFLDQGVGALFVVRAAGNTYDQLALDSIRYTVGHLGTRLIVVIGHDQCGAVTAAVKEYPAPTQSPMLKNIYPAVKQTRGKPGDAVSNAISENAILVARKLAHDPEFAPLVASGELKIVPARYNMATGALTLLSEK
jgi:carbonic anhydrase